MATITIPKTQFEILKKRASLYEAMLKTLPERKWGIEQYSPTRIREFMRQDRLDRKTRARLNKIFSRL